MGIISPKVCGLEVVKNSLLDPSAPIMRYDETMAQLGSDDLRQVLMLCNRIDLFLRETAKVYAILQCQHGGAFTRSNFNN